MTLKIVKYSIFSLIVLLAFVGILTVVFFSLRFCDDSRNTGIPFSPETPASEGDSGPFTVNYLPPHKIYGSSFYFTELNFKDLQSEQQSAFSSSSYYRGRTVNLIFFDPKNAGSRLLFDYPVIISEIDYPDSEQSTLKSHMIYKVIHRDTNGDGVMNSADNKVLFTSDLQGKNLHQITPDTLTVESYQYRNELRGLIILLAIPNHREGIRKEQWERRIYWYDFKTKELQTDKNLLELLEKAKQILGITSRGGEF